MFVNSKRSIVVNGKGVTYLHDCIVKYRYTIVLTLLPVLPIRHERVINIKL
jgi:hypothetical protein